MRARLALAFSLLLPLAACDAGDDTGMPGESTMTASIDGSAFSVKGGTETSAQIRDLDGVYVEGQDAQGRLIVLRLPTTLGTFPMNAQHASLCYSAYSCVSVTGGTYTLTGYGALSHASGTFSFYGTYNGRVVNVTNGTFNFRHGIIGNMGYD